MLRHLVRCDDDEMAQDEELLSSSSSSGHQGGGGGGQQGHVAPSNGPTSSAPLPQLAPGRSTRRGSTSSSSFARRLELLSPVGAEKAVYPWPLKKGKGSMRRSEVRRELSYQNVSRGSPTSLALMGQISKLTQDKSSTAFLLPVASS